MQVGGTLISTPNGTPSGKTVAAVENVETLSDAEFLNLILKQKVPRGIMQVNGEDYLAFPFGAVKAGGGFKGKYGTRSYVINVLSIEPHSYTLKYNEEVKVVPFDASKGKLTKASE